MPLIQLFCWSRDCPYALLTTTNGFCFELWFLVLFSPRYLYTFVKSFNEAEEFWQQSWAMPKLWCVPLLTNTLHLMICLLLMIRGCNYFWWNHWKQILQKYTFCYTFLRRLLQEHVCYSVKLKWFQILVLRLIWIFAISWFIEIVPKF